MFFPALLLGLLVGPRQQRFPPRNGPPGAIRRSKFFSGTAAALLAWPVQRSWAAADTFAALSARLEDAAPSQRGTDFSDALGAFTNPRMKDALQLPAWLEGEWAVTSNIVGTAAPLGRRFLPTDLSRIPLGDLRGAAPPLRYTVRFRQREGDGAIVSDRPLNLKASQDAAAGYQRVEAVDFDGVSKLSVRQDSRERHRASLARRRAHAPRFSESPARRDAAAASYGSSSLRFGTLQVAYSEFGPNRTYVGPSRAEVYINGCRQSVGVDVASGADAFAFAESTRTVLLTQSPRTVWRHRLESAHLHVCRVRQCGFAAVRPCASEAPSADGVPPASPFATQVAVSDSETINRFVREGGTDGPGGAGAAVQGGGAVLVRQRVLRYLTPNPNSAEGVLWQESGRESERESKRESALALRWTVAERRIVALR